ncbi:Obtusifoliol 14-alpha demethylase (Fragment) [Seminavis robusta]|uniref:Obtusifoliol 14-alpha demethylase n=1 Tax=Seminavis robusta TaxID=568900 RepID=A0A9N8E8K3_9STRA
MLWLQIFAVIVFALYFFVLRPRRGGKDAPPLVLESPVFPIPVIGVIMEFFKSPNTMVKRCYRDYGPVFTIPIFTERLTFLMGPEAQSVFFKSNDDQLTQQGVYDFMKPVFGPEVVYDAPKKKRQVQFQSMANGLRATRLKGYVAKIEEETRRYLRQEWGDEPGQLDLLKSLSELTILTASRCLHGEDVRKSLFKEVEALYKDLDHGLLPYTPFWPDAPTPAHRRRNWARKEMVALFSKVIKERRENPSNSDGTDILSLFMETKYKDGTPVTDEQMTGLMIALLFAGQHTSCLSSTWTSLFMADDPTMVDRMIKEQEQVLDGDMSKPLDYETVGRMEFLQNCMTEALRMCPTFIMLIRKALVNLPVTVTRGGEKATYVIPIGDQVVVSPTASMRMKETFPNPDTFDPDRYAPGREEHKIPYAYLGFGGGLHSCMGQNFAYMQVKTVLSILFREYEIERVAPTDFPSCAYEDMVVGPKEQCIIKYKKRVYKDA